MPNSKIISSKRTYLIAFLCIILIQCMKSMKPDHTVGHIKRNTEIDQLTQVTNNYDVINKKNGSKQISEDKEESQELGEIPDERQKIQQTISIDTKQNPNSYQLQDQNHFNKKTGSSQKLRLLIDCAITGCSECSSTTSCGKCEDSYVLDVGKCWTPNVYPTNCVLAYKSGSPSRYRCTNCSFGYSLNTTQGTCSQCEVLNCSSCPIDKLSKCDKCDDGFYVSSSNTSCLNCNSNCVNCSSSYDCSNCVSGYVLYNGEFCGNCGIDYCAECTSNGSGKICTQCFGNNLYILSNNQCLDINSTSNSTSNSIVISDFACDSGCSVCSLVNQQINCSQCEQGYGVNGTSGECRKCQNSCKTCKDYNLGQCTTCYRGYVMLSNNTCVRCPGNYCLYCSPANISYCFACIDSYYLHSNKSCVACNEGCKQCDQSGNCQTCTYGYHLQTYLNGTEKCVSCISGCGDCQTWNGKCTECFPRYFLYQNSTCSVCKENCWKCTSSNDCFQCIPSKILVDNSCVDAVSYCKTPNNLGLCSECLVGYYLNPSTNLCEYDYFASFVDSKRYSCQSGAYLYSFECYVCSIEIANCESCQADYCVKCSAGYYISNSGQQCISCSIISNCMQCLNSKVCSKCSDGYYLQTDIQKADNSIIATEGDVLSSYGVCLACNLNCLTCELKDTICITCKSGYLLTTNRNCIPQSKFNFEILIDQTYTDFYNSVDSFKTELASLIKDSDNVSIQIKKKFIQLTGIKQGSVNVSGYVSASSSDYLKQTFSNFNSLAAGGQINNKFTVISSKITNYTTTNNTTTNSQTPASGNPTNIFPIIIGIIAGVVVVIVVVVVICCCFYKKKKVDIQEASEKKSQSTGEQMSQSEKNLAKQSDIYRSEDKDNKKEVWKNPQYYL